MDNQKGSPKRQTIKENEQQQSLENEEQQLDYSQNDQSYEEDINHIVHNPLGEEIRLSTQSIKQYQSDADLQLVQNKIITDQRNKISSLRQEQTQLIQSEGEGNNFQGNSRVTNRQKNANIFGRARSGSRSRDSYKSDDPSKNRQKNEKIEREYEKKCLRLLKVQDWHSLDQIASQHLEDTKGTSFKGFFYLGVSFYKTGDYENAVRAFQKGEELSPEDAQLQYNLGLANFKLEQYNQAVDHFKKCTKLDPQHPFAYNNLAYLYNMHQFYSETIQVCGCAKMNNPNNHNCHRHWAFALFKKGEMAKAIKKIKKGIQKSPTDPENWIIWGLILRTVGNYASARHKFKKALKIDKDNETAKLELLTVEKIIELDSQIPLDAVPSIRKSIQQKKGAEVQGIGSLSEGCSRSCNTQNNCKIF